jgi:tetratricopeptide (TPR) repeat protein
MVSCNLFHFSFCASKRIFLTLIISFSYFLAISQKDDLLKANKLFDEKRYGEAIPIYDKIFEKKKDRSVLLKMADANYFNENYPQARIDYAKYFNDTVYEHIPQFSYYARSCRLSGKISEAVKLYQKLYDITQADSSKQKLDIYRLYEDSSQFVRSYNLDSNYKCVTIDASQSLDTLAAPMFYSWLFEDGKVSQGLIVERCFNEAGEHKVILNITDKRTGLIRKRDTMLVIYIENPAIRFTMPENGRRYFYHDFKISELNLTGFDLIDFLWEMGNGDVKEGQKIKYKYNESGEYLIKLVIIARNITTGKYELFSANKKFTVLENYEVPSKKFTDTLNGVK